MAKRSVEKYRPVGLARILDEGHRYISDSVVERLVLIGGPIPAKPIEITIVDDAGHLVTEHIAGRAALAHFLEKAATAFHLGQEDQVRPTSHQLASEFADIQAAARRLLIALRVGRKRELDEMPPGLLDGGLLPFAAEEAAQLEVARGRAGRELLGYEGAELLGEAIRGVDRLERWAGTAHERKARTAKNRPTPKRHEGDGVLDAFVRSVIVDCWYGVCGRPLAEGPALFEFVQVAADGVGKKMSKEAARDRIRRTMGRRGKSK